MPDSTPVLTLYRRADCHLCDDAAALLGRLQLRWHAVDVDTDPELVRRYGDRVPVLTRGDQEITQAPISEVSLRSALTTAASDAPD